MKESNLINTNNPVNEGDLAFYQDKMKSIIDGGIYELFKNLSADFCNSKYHTDQTNLLFGAKPEEEQKNYLEQWEKKYKQAKENSK